MANTTTISKTLSVEVQAYLYNESDESLDTDTKKTAIIKVPNYSSSSVVSESTIKTSINNYLKGGTSNAIYYIEDDEGEYHFPENADNLNKEIVTAYTTNQTVTSVDIGYSD